MRVQGLGDLGFRVQGLGFRVIRVEAVSRGLSVQAGGLKRKAYIKTRGFAFGRLHMLRSRRGSEVD